MAGVERAEPFIREAPKRVGEEARCQACEPEARVGMEAEAEVEQSPKGAVNGIGAHLVGQRR